MINILHRLDNPVKKSLREDIDLRRRGRLLPLLQEQPLWIHIRKARNQRGRNTLIKREEDDRHRPLLPHILYNQRMITVDTKE